MKKYYKVLGLPLNATREDIKSARNNLLKKYHPDIYQGSMSFAEEKSAEINEAFEKISEFLDKQERQNSSSFQTQNNNTSRSKKTQSSTADEKFSNQIRSEIRRKREEKAKKLREKKERKLAREFRSKERKESREKRRISREEKSKSSLDEEEKINRLTKDRPTIDNTLIEDERNPEKIEKTILDFLIYGFIAVLILLVILYFTGVLK